MRRGGEDFGKALLIRGIGFDIFPFEETTIINRCPKENTYEYRLKMGTLP